MKRIIIIFCLWALLLAFGYGCEGAAYVTEEPSYIEESRPLAPSNMHVWIGSDWLWNSGTHSYYHRNGYWAPPQRGRTYQPGSWHNGPRGHSWNRGRWR